MSENPKRNDALEKLKNYKEQLVSLGSVNDQPFSILCDEYNTIFFDVFNKIIPTVYVYLTDEEKTTYIYELLYNPMILSSFPFSCLMSLIQSKAATKNKKEQFTIYIHFLKKLLSHRIMSLLEEITNDSQYSGIDAILRSEYNTSILNSLLHTPDVVTNVLLNATPSFFHYDQYNQWLADKILRVYLGFTSDRNLQLYAKLVTKCCLLGLTKHIVHSIYSFLQLYDKKKSACREDRLLLLNKAEVFNHIIHFIQIIPEMRYYEFIQLLLTVHFNDSLQIRDIIILTLILNPNSISQDHVQQLASLFITVEFPLKPLLSFINTLYLHDTKTISSESDLSSLPSYIIISSLFTSLASDLFNQQNSSSHQLYLASLAYCYVYCSFLFSSSSTLISIIMQAVSKRLGTGSQEFKDRIIGIASKIAIIVQPEKQYDWPKGNLTELITFCNEVIKHAPEEIEEEKEEKEEKELPKEEITSIPKKSTSLDMEEFVDIFEEEESYELFHQLDEMDDNSTIPEKVTNSVIDMDSDDDFIPYDLTEPEVQPSISKEYHFLQEPLVDFANDDMMIRLHAWKSLLVLCKEEKAHISFDAVKDVLTTILAFEEMQTDNDFWLEWCNLISILIFKQCEASMQCILKYIKENGRHNITINKAIVLLKAIKTGSEMLMQGTWNIMKNEQEEEVVPEIRISSAVEEKEENGMIRVAKTKYRPSYYKNKILNNKKQQQANAVSSSPLPQNHFTKNSPYILQCLVTWALRVPPRENECIAYLLYTLSFICSLSVLTAVFDENYRDICSILLRYRFHRDASIRRGSLDLFLSTTKYDERNCIGDQCYEFQNKTKVVDWMQNVMANDPDDICRAIARSVLQQINE